MNADDVLQKLKALGCKLTPQRRMLVDLMLGAGDDQLTADDIYQGIRVIYPDVGLDTIYRNLRLLVKLNVIDETKRPGKLAQYSLNRRVHQHGLVCLECGTEIPLGHCPIKELEMLAREEHGFVIATHKIELFGYCPKCSDGHPPV